MERACQQARTRPPPAPGPVLFYSKSAVPAHRRLSNFEVFSAQEGEFASAEHYFQGYKYAHSTRPGLTDTFRVGGEVVTPLDAKRAGARRGMQARGAQLRVDRFDAARDGIMRDALEYRALRDVQFAADLAWYSLHGTKLYHFERGGARAYWGGNFPKDAPRSAAAFRGQNRLGQLMMELGKQLLLRFSLP